MNNYYIIIGNIISFIGCILMVIAGYTKSSKKTIVIQTVEILFLAIANLFLGGYTGMITNFISIIRNYLCYKDKLNFKIKILFILLLTIISVYFNNVGIIGLLPIISSIIYTAFLGANDKQLKILIFVTTIFWLIYDFNIKNYTGFVFDILTLFSSIIGFLRIIKVNQK